MLSHAKKFLFQQFLQSFRSVVFVVRPLIEKPLVEKVSWWAVPLPPQCNFLGGRSGFGICVNPSRTCLEPVLRLESIKSRHWKSFHWNSLDNWKLRAEKNLKTHRSVVRRFLFFCNEKIRCAHKHMFAQNLCSQHLCPDCCRSSEANMTVPQISKVFHKLAISCGLLPNFT